MLTVENLRKMGYRVKVRHNREYVDSRFAGIVDNGKCNLVQQDTFNPYGGMTEVEVYDYGTQCGYTAFAECSKKDHYCRKLGVRIALGRVLKMMGINPKKPNMLEYQIKILEDKR